MKRFLAFAFVCSIGFVAGMTVRSISAGVIGYDPYIVNRAQSWIHAAEDGDTYFSRFYAAYQSMNELGASILIEGRDEEEGATTRFEREEARMKVALGRLLVDSANRIGQLP